MKIFCVLLVSLCSLLLFAKSGFAEEHLPPANLLQKLSLKLRGKAPTPTEIAEFRDRITQSPDKFQLIYQEKIAEFLKSPEFEKVIEDFHGIWWRLPRSETTALAAYIVSQDRPYFEIFNKSYLFVDGERAPNYIHSNVGTEGPLPESRGDWRAIRLDKNEARFRSIFSDLDFLNQYPDTPTNKNRSRSNYVFKTFLCEVLAPPATAGKETRGRVSFSHGSLTGDDSDEHGSNPDCIGCHYRLDPMARFFDHWRPPGSFTDGTWFDASQSAKGKVLIREADGTTRSYAGEGESDLGRILRSEPRVPQCVAKKAWEFIFGTGIKLASTTQTQLVTALQARESFKDLITQVVSHPYFWSTAEVPSLRFEDIKPDLTMCAGCHEADGDYEPKFNPLVYPFSAETQVNQQILKRIWGAINRRSGFTPMPLAPRPKLPDDSLSRIREWISAGSIDDQGHVTLNDTQIDEVLNDGKIKK